jgi:hypothetical protein
MQYNLNKTQRVVSHSLVSHAATSKPILSLFILSSLITTCVLLSGSEQLSHLAIAQSDQSEPALAHTIKASSNRNISTYENPSLGLSLQYPSNWKVEERTNINNNTNDSNASSIKFTSPSKRDLFVVSVYTQNLSSLPVEQQHNTTLNSLTRIGINTAKANLNNFQLIDLETANVTLGLDQNNQAHKIIYSNTNTNMSFPLQFVTMQTYTIKDGKIYGLSYVSEASQFLRHLPAVQRMIDSFRITG